METGDACTARTITKNVVHIEEAVVRVVRVERQAEQSLLAAAVHLVHNIKERCWQHGAIGVHYAYFAHLQHSEEAVIPRMGDVHYSIEPCGEGVELNGHRCLRHHRLGGK